MPELGAQAIETGNIVFKRFSISEERTAVVFNQE